MSDTTDYRPPAPGDVPQEHRPPVMRLSRDLVVAAKTLSDEEARFLVDAYYIMQEDRKRSNNQARSMEKEGEEYEPNSVIAWLASQSGTLEDQIKRALDSYTMSKPIGEWMQSIYGIGPVIAAGLMAHIDIEQAPTAGHIWRFAGLDPTTKWEKGQKRPWNAGLKTLCWKVGQSFMKFSNQPDCVYGRHYRERKEYEIRRNDSGGNAARAAQILTEKKFGRTTDARKHLEGGKLPPAQIDAMARRWAVKLFLAHVQLVWWFIQKGELPAAPYAMTHLGHAHIVLPPNIERVPGLVDALKKYGNSQRR